MRRHVASVCVDCNVRQQLVLGCCRRTLVVTSSHIVVQEPFVKATAGKGGEVATRMPSEVRINSVHQDQVGPEPSPSHICLIIDDSTALCGALLDDHELGHS